MKIILMKNEKLESFLLNHSVVGNYWITDTDSNNKKRNLVNVEAINGKWVLKSNFEVKIFFNGQEKDDIELSLHKFYVLKINNDSDVILYTDNIFESSYLKLRIQDGEYMIGKAPNCDIIFNYNAIKEQHLKVVYKNSSYHIEDVQKSGLLYINNKKKINCDLKYGDVLFLCGLKIILMKDYILLNQIGNSINYSNKFGLLDNNYFDINISDYDEESNIKPLYNKDDYLY